MNAAIKIGRKEVAYIAILLVALIIAILQPFPGAAPITQYTLSLLMFVVSSWALKPFGLPMSVSALAFMGMLVVIGVPFAVAASGFTSSSTWLMLAGLFFGFVMLKTGVAKRIAYLTLKIFPPTYLGIIIGMGAVAAIFSLLTPSITVRLAIMCPIALGLIECAKIPKRSSMSAGILLTFFVANLLIGSGWFTGALTGPIMYGLAPPVAKPYLLPSEWLSVMFVPMEIMAVSTVAAFAFLLFRPNQKLECTRFTLQEEYAQLGPWTKDQKITLTILAVTVVGWLLPTFGIINLDSTAVGLIGLFLLFLTRQIMIGDIPNGINWDFIIYMGFNLGLTAILSATKFSGWVGGYLGPLFYPLASNLIVLLVALGGFMVIMRFWDVSYGLTTVAILSGSVVPGLMALGINPACLYFVFILMGSFLFIVQYQQPWLLMADNLTKGEILMNRDTIRAGITYMLLGFVIIVIAALYWQATGLAFITPP